MKLKLVHFLSYHSFFYFFFAYFSGFVKIELNDGSILVFDAEEANKRTEIILKKHKIPSMTNLDI